MKAEEQEYEMPKACGYQSKEKRLKVKKSLEKPPLTTFLRVNTTVMSIKESLKAVQEYVDQQCKDKNWERIIVKKHPVLSDVLYLSVIGPFTDLKPNNDNEIIVDSLCANAIWRGSDIYSTGIIAATKGIKEGDYTAIYVDLDKKCLRGSTQVYKGNKMFIGNGMAKVKIHDVLRVSQKQVSGVGISVTETMYRSPSFGNMTMKGIYLQNLPSILVSHVLQPQENDCILDMCAAPGGKTMHLATLARNKAIIIAHDRSKKKVNLLNRRLEKEGCLNVYAYVCDSTGCVGPSPFQNNSCSNKGNNSFRSENCYDKENNNSSDELVVNYDVVKNENSTKKLSVYNLPPRGSIVKSWPRESFDRILLDGPCSALGQRPNHFNQSTSSYSHSPTSNSPTCSDTNKSEKQNDIKVNRWKEDIDHHAALQRSLLHAAVKLLKPGGHLLYSTCTISFAENEGNVLYALNTFGNRKNKKGNQSYENDEGNVSDIDDNEELELVDLPKQFKFGQPGLNEGWTGSEEDRLKLQRFDPDVCIELDDSDNDCEGQGKIKHETIGFFFALFRKKQ